MELSEEFELRKKREVGEIVSAGIKFLRLNLSEIFTGYVYFVLPWMLIASAVTYISGGEVLSYLTVGNADFSTDKLITTGIFYFMFVAAYMIAYGLIYSVILRKDGYLEENQNTGISIPKISLKLFFFYAMVIGLIFILVGTISFVLMQISPFLLVLIAFFSMIGIVWAMVPLSIAPFVYIRENLGIIETVKRSLDIIKGQWGNTFLVIFVSSIIAAMCSYLFLIPIYLISFAFGFSMLDLSNGTLEGWLPTVILVLSSMVSILVNMYTITCITLKYYDLVEQKEGTLLTNKISSIGSQKDSLFENEGEF